MLTIREMLPEDAEATGYVHYTSWLESYSGLVDSDFLSRTSPERSRQITLRCRDRTLVAQLDGEIVGFCCYGMNQSGRPEIFGLYLLKKPRASASGGSFWMLRFKNSLRKARCTSGYSRAMPTP